MAVDIFSQLFGTDTTKFSGTRETCPGRSSKGLEQGLFQTRHLGGLLSFRGFARLAISIESAPKLY
jgi:hypothetical protein